MKIEITYSKIIPLVILFITVSSINQWTYLPIGNTLVWWFIYSFVLILFVKAKKDYFDISQNRFINPIWILLIWNIVCIIRGVFVAQIYWEWKNLIGTSMVLLLPVSIYITTNKFLIQKVFIVWFKYALPAFFLFFVFFKYNDAAGRYLVPVSFLLLFLPVLKLRWKLTLLLFCLFVIIGSLDARSNVIKFTVSFIFGFIYYFRLTPINKVIKLLRVAFLVLPWLFFILGTTEVFNVFKMNEYIQGDFTSTITYAGEEKESDLLSDTRTGLYRQVLNSAFKYNYTIFGRTPARGNESETFGLYALEVLRIGKMERYSNEVSILNVFTWTGAIGVVLYFLVFLKASRLAISCSNNIFIKIIGLNVSFRWAYAWVEDFSRFDLSNFILWIMIGMCFSKAFREMTNREMTYWALGIFEKKYRRRISNPKPSLFLQNKIHENYSGITNLP